MTKIENRITREEFKNQQEIIKVKNPESTPKAIVSDAIILSKKILKYLFAELVIMNGKSIKMI